MLYGDSSLKSVPTRGHEKGDALLYLGASPYFLVTAD